MPKAQSNSDARDVFTASGDLLDRARAGDSRALSTLFRRQGHVLRRWAHGRLPAWARRMTDTADMVQEALLQTFRRLDHFENRGKGALQAYLRQAVHNRIQDEMRRVVRRPLDDLPDGELPIESTLESPFDATARHEQDARYKRALNDLNEDERVLVVGRLELGYNYEQLALVSGRSTPDAARLAVRRAVLKLAQAMSRV